MKAMPRSGHIWRHVVLTTHGQWLPGDPRGFRSRDHRIHSGGDYKHRPPTGEHAQLHAWNQRQTEDAVVLAPAASATGGRAILATLAELAFQSLAIAVCPTHTHLLAALPQNPDEAMRVIHRVTGASSRAVFDLHPGRIWARGASLQPIHDRAHQRRTFHYILERQGLEAWTWSFRDEPIRG